MPGSRRRCISKRGSITCGSLIAACLRLERSRTRELARRNSRARSARSTLLHDRGRTRVPAERRCPRPASPASIRRDLLGCRNRPCAAADATAGELRRLGTEIEMWLHGAPFNTARERDAGKRRISALWLWGARATTRTSRRWTRRTAARPAAVLRRRSVSDRALAGSPVTPPPVSFRSNGTSRLMQPHVRRRIRRP